MAERVAFTKSVTLSWLSEAAEYSIQGKTRKEAGDLLNATIGQQISNAVNIKQTRIILLRAWFDTTPILLDRARAQYLSVTSDEKMAIHWSLLIDQYAIFFDLCDVIGHLYAFRDVITLKQIKERIYEKWGERSILCTSLSKNIKTLKELGAITAGEHPGYYVLKKHTMTDPHVAGLLLYAMLHSIDQRYITWTNFASHPAMFPFSFVGMDESDIATLDFISLDRFNNQTVLSLVE